MDHMGDGLEGMTTARDIVKQASIEAPGAMISRYDSGKEENGYLADALNVRTREMKAGMLRLKHTDIPEQSKTIVLGSLVEIENLADNDSEMYFVLPYGGGEFIEYDLTEIMVVTPDSPLFKAMVGKGVGEEFILNTRAEVKYKILDLQWFYPKKFIHLL